MLKPLALSLVLALGAIAQPAAAQSTAPKAPAAAAAATTEERIAEAVEKLVGRKVESVTKAPFLGLYEVYTAGDIIYTDNDNYNPNHDPYLNKTGFERSTPRK